MMKKGVKGVVSVSGNVEGMSKKECFWAKRTVGVKMRDKGYLVLGDQKWPISSESRCEEAELIVIEYNFT